MAKLTPNDFNHKVKLGNVITVKNKFTGASSKEFAKVLEVRFAAKTRTLNQQYQIQGTDLENSRTIIIRHNSSVEGLKLALIDGVQYDIVNYSPDETSSLIRYDYLTLKRSS